MTDLPYRITSSGHTSIESGAILFGQHKDFAI